VNDEVEPALKLGYSVREAARAVGVSRDVIRAEIHANRLAAKKYGDRPVFLIPTAELKRWFESLPDV
jgi:excisionase family DNA binding protein